MEQNYTIEMQCFFFMPQHQYNKVEKVVKNTTTLPQHWGWKGRRARSLRSPGVERERGREGDGRGAPCGRPVSFFQFFVRGDKGIHIRCE